MLLRQLLTLSGAIEAIGGILTLIAPAVVVTVLLEPSPDTVAMVLARFFGAGMFALGLVCLKARDHVRSPAGLAVVYGITFYNIASAVLIIWAAASANMNGPVLMMAGLGHAVLGILFVRELMVLPAEQSKVGG